MKHFSLLLFFLCSVFSLGGEIGLGQPDPYISDKLWTAQRNVARKVTATAFRIVLGTKELKDPFADRLSDWGRSDLGRVFYPLAAEGFDLHITLEGEDYGCLRDIIRFLDLLPVKVTADPGNELAAFKIGGNPTPYVARMKWLQAAIAGTDIQGATGVNHGWFGPWVGNANALTADFGNELQSQLNQIDHVYAPGSELRKVNGWARFATNCYVSYDVWNIREALIQKARAIERKVHGFREWGGYNREKLIFAEIGVWLPPYDRNNPYNMALGVGGAIKEIKTWPGVSTTFYYAPAGDVNYGLVRSDGSENVSRVNGLRKGLGIQ